MKKYLIPLLLLTACGNQKSIETGPMRLTVGEEMELRIEQLDPGAQPLAQESAAVDRLTTDRGDIADFRLTDSRLRGATLELRGRYENGGVVVEKLQTVTAPKEFPGMVTVSTRFINCGEPMAVNSLTQHSLRVEADTLVWSFEPTSSVHRADWLLPVRLGFSQDNYLGMNSTDYGGGIPMVDLWRADCGVAVGLTESVLKTISMPVEWAEGENAATAALRRDFPKPLTLERGDTLAGYDTFIILHTGDYFNPLRQYSEYMQQMRGLDFAASEPEAFEPVWCAWGYGREFTIDEILGTLDKVAEVGFKWVDIDDGYQIAEGDWETNSRFPGGDADMRRITDAIHARGMKAKLWWAPMSADPGTKCLTEHPERMLVTESGEPEFISWWDSYYLSPVNPSTVAYTLDLTRRFIDTWNFDGLKLDGQYLNCCMPDYNPASGLASPEDAVEQLPGFFKAIFDYARGIKPNAVVQLCPCGCAINFYHLPYMNQAVASDPTSSWQIRLKGKTYKALNPRLAYYADHVELSDGGCDFATQFGVGGVLGSKFTYPKPNPRQTEPGDFLLHPDKEIWVKKWVSLYNRYRLSQGDYLNLYDIGWDKPETHVIRKDGALYYAFYADQWQGGEIRLRGLKPDGRYTITEYTADEPRSYTVEGSDPVIRPQFTHAYLIEVRAADPKK